MPAYVISLLFLELLVSYIALMRVKQPYGVTLKQASLLIKMHFSKAFFILVIKSNATVVH